MQHNWFLKTDIDNFNSNIQLTKKNLLNDCFNSKKHTVCFSHVPKTGGTSLESILFKNCAAADVLHVNAPDLNQQPQLLNLKRNAPKMICGHHPMHGLLYQLLPDKPIFHFTQLRDPIDRVLSYYNYVNGKQDHPMHKHAVNQSLLGFLQASPSPELSNGQCKRFSGYLHHGEIEDHALFEIAHKTLSECFSLVLTTCLFDEGLLLLKSRLGLKDIYYQRSNVSQTFISRDDLSNQEITTIENMNQADSRLFAWAKSTCQTLINEELSPRQIENFRANNTDWAKLING